MKWVLLLAVLALTGSCSTVNFNRTPSVASESSPTVLISEQTPKPADRESLSTFSKSLDLNAPIEANSDQMLSIYLGATPREMMLGLPTPARPSLPDFMKDLGTRQALEVSRVLKQGPIELEAWPSEVDGMGAWVFARWRKSSRDTWKWLDGNDFKGLVGSYEKSITPAPILPHQIKLTRKKDIQSVFNDFLDSDDLYFKPSFADTVWTSSDGSQIYGAWLPPGMRSANWTDLRARKELLKDLRGWVLPQPARFNADPVVFDLKVSKKKVAWPTHIEWSKPIGPDEFKDEFKTETSSVVVRPWRPWPASFNADYERDLKVFSGEDQAVFPVSGRKMRFLRKNSTQKDHQLGDLVDYLEERYRVLGLETERMPFNWRGISQANLIVKLKGSQEGPPFIMVDHMDTAFAEDVFEKTGKRVSVPGADDNATAVAALLKAAERLRDVKLKRDVWLIHLTGEEFPGDDLGVRVLIQEFRRRKQDVEGFIVLDMIGYKISRKDIFQINPSNTRGSIKMAQVAEAVSRRMIPRYEPKMRLQFDERSYLYNTDGRTLAWEGYNVMLINEEMNRFNLYRKGYHDMTDTVANVNLEYAASIVKVAIETIERLATE